MNTRVEQVEQQVTRIRNLLRLKIREKGLTQLKVQYARGWGRSYISQLFNKQKNIRYDQVLLILHTIGIAPGDFFAEVFYADWPPGRAEPEPRSLAELLVVKGIITNDDLDHLLGSPQMKPHTRS